MLTRFPPPSDRTDLFALHVVNKLDEINQNRDFMISVGELDDNRFVVGLSGMPTEDFLKALHNKLNPETIKFRYLVWDLSSLREKMLNPFEHISSYGFDYKGRRDCSEPKIIECARALRKRLIAMTTVWYGREGNKAWKKSYILYQEIRLPLGGVRPGQLNFAKPCGVCQANERRLMLYLEEGFPTPLGKPRFGSYESPF